MNVLQVGAVLVLIVAATATWKSGVLDGAGERIAAAGRKPEAGGFVSMPMPDGLSSRGIVIFTPQNCPSEAAQRARRLAEHLSAQRIGYVQSSQAEFSNLASQEEASRVMSVMNGPIPVVYVNGRAKANPTPEEVEAEYRRASDPG